METQRERRRRQELRRPERRDHLPCDQTGCRHGPRTTAEREIGCDQGGAIYQLRFTVRAEIMAGSDNLRIYHERRSSEPEEAPGVQLDDGGDEYGELLSLPRRTRTTAWEAPIYEPGEVETLKAEHGPGSDST